MRFTLIIATFALTVFAAPVSEADILAPAQLERAVARLPNGHFIATRAALDKDEDEESWLGARTVRGTRYTKGANEDIEARTVQGPRPTDKEDEIELEIEARTVRGPRSPEADRTVRGPRSPDADPTVRGQ